MTMPTKGPTQGIDVVKIMTDAKANRLLLESCRRPHDFTNLKDRALWPRYQCSKCNGIVGWESAIHYIEGLKDGRLQESTESTEGR